MQSRFFHCLYPSLVKSLDLTLSSLFRAVFRFSLFMWWPWALFAWGRFICDHTQNCVYCGMRESQPGPLEAPQKWTFCLPIHSDTDHHARARALFTHIEGQTPFVAEAFVSDTSSLNDAAFSCLIAPYGSEKGLRFFLANPDEGFDHAQVFAGPSEDEEIDKYGDHDGKFTDVLDFTDWLFNAMLPKHPFFKDFGITPLFITDKEKLGVYINLLHKHGLGYHMDDCPWDCLRDADLTLWERVLIEFYHDQCWKWCNENDEDIHEYCVSAFEQS